MQGAARVYLRFARQAQPSTLNPTCGEVGKLPKIERGRGGDRERERGRDGEGEREREGDTTCGELGKLPPAVWTWHPVVLGLRACVDLECPDVDASLFCLCTDKHVKTKTGKAHMTMPASSAFVTPASIAFVIALGRDVALGLCSLCGGLELRGAEKGIKGWGGERFGHKATGRGWNQ